MPVAPAVCPSECSDTIRYDEWIIKDGSTMRVPVGSYHVHYLTMTRADGAQRSYGNLVIDDNGTDYIVKLAELDPTDTTHQDYRSYERFLGATQSQ